jgi:hypothetical protein
MERVRAQYAPLGVDAADKGDLVIKEKRGSAETKIDSSNSITQD